MTPLTYNIIMLCVDSNALRKNRNFPKLRMGPIISFVPTLNTGLQITLTQAHLCPHRDHTLNAKDYEIGQCTKKAG